MTTGFGYMILVPECPNCGVESVYMNTYAPKNRHPGAGIENLVQVECICGTRQMYFTSKSTWHSYDGLVIHESRGRWRIVHRRSKVNART